MSRNNAYYLDTNIVVHALFARHNLDSNVSKIISDPTNFLYTSHVVVKELIHLLKRERVKLSKSQKDKTVFERLNEAGIVAKPVTLEHLGMYETLTPARGHNDPNDMLIIAQSISDRITLISSDRLFANYKLQGLDLVYNKM